MGPDAPNPPSSQVFKSFLWTLLMVSCGVWCVFLSLPQYLFVGFILFTRLAKENTLLRATKPRKREKKKRSTLCLETMRKQTHVCGVWIHTCWCGQVRASWLEEGTRGQCSMMLLLFWLFWGAAIQISNESHGGLFLVRDCSALVSLVSCQIFLICPIYLWLWAFPFLLLL